MASTGRGHYTIDHDDGYEVEIGNNNNNNNKSKKLPQRDSSRLTSKVSNSRRGGPVDLDELLFDASLYVDDDDESLFSATGDEDSAAILDQAFMESQGRQYFSNPNKNLLDTDASLIPGSPFSKPPNKPSNRPKEPLALAKYASTLAFLITFIWVGSLFFFAIWNYTTVSRIIVECFLAVLSFFGLFWNSYFIISSILKCFIPVKAFLTNTKYCSIIPETKAPEAAWLDVTIQIPVYKESLCEVLMPTLKSCILSRDYYQKNTGARCNIVICDDGMMAFLRDNFPAAEMLWENIVQTKGQVIKLSALLKHVPRASRRHLKGLHSKNVYEVFHRMLFYYHYKIGFVARSTVDRRGKFKKASNLNSHLRLALGAAQSTDDKDKEMAWSFDNAIHEQSHNEDGSRYIMSGGDIRVGALICVNDADARMAESVILKTVPEFLNDSTLGFTQHTTKTMKDQRGESYFVNLLTVYTDALYQGHFLLSSILGCHPPLVGHSIFLRTEAVKQCGRMRVLRNAQRWLQNIGLPFIQVDQIGFTNLRAESKIEYWSECHVSEDFELMIHLYNLGFNGRYCAYPDCEFEEGITRTFDEEAGRHRKFALGGHELVFNPFQDMLGHGIFTPLFRTFMSCDIPSYYKIFLTAYLCSYTSGGAYIIVFTVASIAWLLDGESDVSTLYAFSPAGIIVLNIVVYYLVGYLTFVISLVRMYAANKNLFFPEYRKQYCGSLYIVFMKIRYSMLFQFLFYSCMGNFYFLGSMDHLLSRPGVVSATNKDSIISSRCSAFYEMAKFNIGSWMISLFLGGLAYAVVLESLDWKFDAMPETTDDWIRVALFSGPAALLAVFSFVVPIILNPYILGWPFHRQNKKPKKKEEPVKKAPMKKDHLGRAMVDVGTYIDKAKELDKEIERAQGKDDFELGSLTTHELRSTGSPKRETSKRMNVMQPVMHEDAEQRTGRTTAPPGLWDDTQIIPEFRGSRVANGGRQPLAHLAQGPPIQQSRSSKSRRERDPCVEI